MNRRQFFAALAALPFLGRLAPPAAAEPESTFTLLGDFVPQSVFMDEATAAAWDEMIAEERQRQWVDREEAWLETPRFDARMAGFDKIYLDNSRWEHRANTDDTITYTFSADVYFTP